MIQTKEPTRPDRDQAQDLYFHDDTGKFSFSISNVFEVHQSVLGQRGGLPPKPFSLWGGDSCPIVRRKWVDMMTEKLEC
ncbi:jg2873 [Pararge aegeria aegeria]|uniref:Jg2873 protein n=1 Tax=Pararge aegeria aegeria TaxID=348720 RepID=A0A8S4SDE1_9NEOP|nr:jg2873 [Pararge aegeria aegeria]